MKRRSVAVLFGSLLLASANVFAGTYTQSPDPANVQAGGSVDVTFSFAGDGTTQDTQLDLTYDATTFPTVTPTVLVPGSVCVVLTNPNRLRIVPPSGAGVALTSTPTAYCKFAMTAAGNAALGNYDFGQDFIECTPAAMPAQTCTRTGTFRVSVVSGPTPPTVAFGTVTQPPGGGAGTAAGSVNVDVTDGGSTTGGAASLTLNCTLPAGSNNFQITSNATKTINAVATSANNYTIGVSCTRGASAGSSTLTCTQTTSPTTQRADLTQQIDCPQAGLTAPSIAYNPAPPGPINYTGNGGATVTKSITVSQTAAGEAGATTTVQNCQISAGFTLNNFSNIVFTGGTANAGGTISTSCTVPAFGQADITGTLSCDEVKNQGASGTSTSTKTWNLNCPAAEPNFNSSPGAGGSVPLSGPPGTIASGGITVNNNGTAPLTFDCGTAAGFTITNGTSAGLAPGGQQTIGVSCTTPSSPGDSFNATLSCTTNDPDLANGVTFNLSCTALILSIPTISAAGKTLLAALLMGLGLLGFAMRRRQDA